MSKKKWINGLALLLFICLAGCEKNLVEDQIPLEMAQTMSPISIPMSTNTPTSTSNPTSTPTDEPTEVPPTSIPVPIIDPEFMIEELLENNNNCDYPCWWGIEPGKASRGDIEQFFSQIPTLTVFSSSTSDLYQDGEYLYYEVPLPEGYSDRDQLNITFYLNDHDLVQVIRSFPKISLEEVLAKFGVPDEIYIWGRGYVLLTDYAEFAIVLNYQQGMALLFEGRTEQGEKIEICPQTQINQDYAGVWLWNPERNFSFNRIANLGINASGALDFQPLEEQTGISVDEFVEKFDRPNSDECFYFADPNFEDK